MIPQILAASPREAAAAAAGFGGRVALKAVSPKIIHKTEMDAVRLGLQPGAVEQEARLMRERAQGDTEMRFLVQAMAPRGVEMIVGVLRDPLFGPVVACGAGGTMVELVKDVSVRISPLRDRDATEMVRSLRSFPMLDGYRSAPKADVAALEDVIMRVGALVDTHPEIVELDANPVIVLAHGAVIVDARVRVDRAARTRPLTGTPR